MKYIYEMCIRDRYYYDVETGFYYLQSRYYDPQTGRFINADSQLNPDLKTGSNMFTYAGNNPVRNTDSTGLWFGLDDLIAGGVGAVVGLGGQLVSDLIAGEFSSWETYIGAGLGGAAGGIVTLYAGPVAGGAVAGGASTLIGQGLEKVTGTNDRPLGCIVINTAVDTGVGALFSKITVDIPGVTIGRNSYGAVYKSGLTKIGNQTVKRMSGKVVTKGILSGLAGDLYIDLYNGVIPGAQYWYDGVGTANGGRGNYMCYYSGHLYVVTGSRYGEVFE